MQTPKQLGFRMPAEWEMQDAVWLSWPHNELTWPPDIISEVETTYAEFVKAMCKAQKVNILVDNESFEQRAKSKLKEGIIDFKNVIFRRIKSADVWVRDYGPTFVVNGKTKEKAIVKWTYNAVGNKYEDLLPDNLVPYGINKQLNLRMFEAGIVLEGGSIDVNGTGTVLTTEQCLLNKNRNPSLSKNQIEKKLMEFLNVSNVLWLKRGVEGDDTDGHIDDIARFVNKNTVVCAFEDDKNDENHEILKENYEMLLGMEDEDGNKLNVVKLPMPKGFCAKDCSKSETMDPNHRMPASYSNFYIGNEVICVPVFGDKNDKKATKILQELFKTRKVVPINCRKMVFGYGSLHCGSQQEPRV